MMLDEEMSLRARIAEIEGGAHAARLALDDGHVPEMIGVLLAAGRAVGDIAALSAAQRTNKERALTRGVRQLDGRILFEDCDGDVRRSAEVYANAHNDGVTYGLSVNRHRRHVAEWQGGMFRGCGWSQKEACAAAGQWVRDGVMPEVRR